MKKKISKKEATQEIEDFFSDIRDKNPHDIKKIKRLAMQDNIPLGKNKRLFCKKCLAVHKNPKIRIKNKTKIITCGKCNYVSRIKLS